MEKQRPHPDIREQAGVSAPPQSGTSARVLVVRDNALRDRVDRAISVSRGSAMVARVPSFLAALGDLSAQSASVVIGPLDAVTGMLESTAKALRELAPESRLIVTAEPYDRVAAQQALKAGFDAALIEPYDTNELAKAMQLESGGLITATSALDTEPATEAQDAHLPDTQQTDTDAPRGESPAPQREAHAASDDQLGDADLIDGLLSGKDDIFEQLSAMIQMQSEIPGIQLLKPRQDPPQDQPAVKVVYTGKTLGLLTAAVTVPKDHLKPWAAWASRWLAMRERLNQLQELALTDELTGAWNRRYFNRFLNRILGRASQERQQVTLLVFDIDDFKTYNDRYGHAAGDEILREAARLMQSVVREHDVVARIGGDEFAVIFWDAEEPRRQGSKHPNDVMRAAKRFQKAITAHRFPKLLDDALGTLTISGGLASYPWDGSTAEDLLDRADRMAMQSKKQGKNAITIGPGASHIYDNNDL